MADERRENGESSSEGGRSGGSGSRQPGPLRGRKLGDRRVRVERPQAEYFRYAAKDTLVARVNGLGDGARRVTEKGGTTGGGSTGTMVFITLGGASGMVDVMAWTAPSV